MHTSTEAPVTGPFQAEVSAVSLRGVERRYRSQRRELIAVADLDLEVGDGEVMAVVGPSGCGKSTLLELVAGLQAPDAGSVSVQGCAEAVDRLAACAHMAQRDLLLPWRDALANAGLALEAQGMSPRAARALAAPLFSRFGLSEFERARPRELSGGMRQRVAFLRTLLAGRPVLLLDEPFGALDSITRASMQEWLAGALAVERRTVLLVTHDVEEALFLGDRVAVMSPRPGRVVDTIDVDLPRPRPRRETVSGSRFGELRERALEALGQ